MAGCGDRRSRRLPGGCAGGNGVTGVRDDAAITDAAGKPLPGSIATLETVTLNDSEQWVSIRGQDVTKPVLLFLAVNWLAAAN